MKISGSNVIDQPVDKVWEALLDPRVLVATIPGCERLESTGDPGSHEYAMTVTAGVAAIKGTYTGSCALSDLHEHQSLVMRLSGAGAPGTVDATVNVAFSEPAPGQTQIAYDADAVVGGMVGGVGQRMLSSVSKRMAGEFFGNVGTALAGGGRAASAASAVETAGGAGRVHRSRQGRRHLLPGRLPQGHRGRCGAGRPRRGDRRDLRAPPVVTRHRRVHRARPGRRRTPQGHLRPRAAGPAPGPDRRAQPGAQRGRVPRRGPRPGGCRRRRRGAGPGRGRRAAARAAVRVQGHARRRGVADHAGLAAVRGPRPRAGRPDRGAGPPRRGHRDRQDQRAGVRGRLAHLQHDLRHDPQPRRPDPVRRRLLGRGGLRARVGHGAARRRLGHGRLAAQPGVVLRRRRPPAEPGPGAAVAGVQPVGDDVGRRPDGAQRRRPRPAAVGHRRARPARAAGARRPRRRPSRRRSAGRSAACGSPCRSTSAAPSRSTTASRRWSSPPGRCWPPPAPP